MNSFKVTICSLAILTSACFSWGQGSSESQQTIPSFTAPLHVVYRITNKPFSVKNAYPYKAFPKEYYTAKGGKVEYFQSGRNWVLLELHDSEDEDVFSGDGKYKRVWLSDGKELLRIEHGGLSCTRYVDGEHVMPAPPLPFLGAETVALPLIWTAPIPNADVMSPYVAPPEKPGALAGVVMSAQDVGDSSRERVSVHQMYQPGYISLEQSGGAWRVKDIQTFGRGPVDSTHPAIPVDKCQFDQFELVQGVPLAKHTVYRAFNPNVIGQVDLQQDWTVSSIKSDGIDPSVFKKATYLKVGAIVSEGYEHITTYKHEGLAANAIRTDIKNNVYPYVTGLSWEEMLARSRPDLAPKYKPQTFGTVLIPTALVGLFVFGGLVFWNARSRKASI